MVRRSLIWAVLLASAVQAAPGYRGDLNRLQHLVVIYQENWSFDGLYSRFPGADGTPPGTPVAQVDRQGRPLAVLPRPINDNLKPPGPDPRFPADLPVATFDLARFVAPTEQTGDLIHRFYHEQLQIDQGKMDRFVAWSDNGGLVLSQDDATDLPEGRLAKQYVMCDRFFHSAFGGSFLNHQWLIAAASPRFANAPAKVVSNPDATSPQFADRQVTPDGYAVNTVYTAQLLPPSKQATDPDLLPPQTHPTIGDRLSAAGVSWKWYSGGWNDVLAGHPHPLFQWHHQPFSYFRTYAPGTRARAEHLRDETELLRDLRAGRLPAVAFVKALGPDNEHPGYSALLQGQLHAATLVRAVLNSRYAKNTVVIIAYDENGGRWDHVAPPVIDRWGPGTRAPAIVIGWFARRGCVDHTVYETASILRLIESRWHLAPLGTRDAQADGFTGALDFGG